MYDPPRKLDVLTGQIDDIEAYDNWLIGNARFEIGSVTVRINNTWVLPPPGLREGDHVLVVGVVDGLHFDAWACRRLNAPHDDEIHTRLLQRRRWAWAIAPGLLMLPIPWLYWWTGIASFYKILLLSSGFMASIYHSLHRAMGQPRQDIERAEGRLQCELIKMNGA